MITLLGALMMIPVGSVKVIWLTLLRQKVVLVSDTKKSMKSSMRLPLPQSYWICLMTIDALGCKKERSNNTKQKR